MANATPIIFGPGGTPVVDVGPNARGMPVELVSSGPASLYTAVGPTVPGAIPISVVGSAPSFADIALRSASFLTYGQHISGTTVPAPASIVNGDILLAQFFFTGNPPPLPAPTPPAGFAPFGVITSVTKGSLTGDMYIYWKRALNESGSYTWLHPTTNSAVWLGSLSGMKTTGVPLGATSNNSAEGQTSTGLSITLTQDKSWLMFFEHDWGDTANNLTPPPGMTERHEGVVLYNASQLFPTAAATGNKAMVNNNIATNPWAVRMVELLAATL